MNLAARQMRTRKARTDLHALDRLNGHQCARNFPIETRVPLRMGSKPDGQSAHDNLEHAAERIARRLCLVDAGFHLYLCRRIAAVQIITVRHADIFVTDCRTVNRHAADLRHMGDNGHTDSGKQLTADRADGNAHRRLACTRPFKDVTRIMAVIFEHTRKIGMPRANGGHTRPRRRTEGIHTLRPVCKVAIHHLQGDRCA